ncbi:MAG: exocyst complex component exo70 [Trizodia sp. TS-e1964]|nr:MAG: exocyst complex component exo70 [Trizodia sp. TS-e1964]
MVGLRATSDAEDRAEVEVLQARCEKTRQLARKIQASLKRLETSGRSVQEAIGPIYGNTQQLQILGTNIDRISAAIAKVREPLDIKSREEATIRAGVQSVGLPEFLNSLKRITRATTDLKNTNLASNQRAISDLNSLYKSGSQQLEDLFRKILKENASPVEPLHYITKQLPFPTLDQVIISELALINSFLSERKSPEHPEDSLGAVIYMDIRGPYMADTLHNLSAAAINTSRKKTPEALYRQGTNGIGTYSAGLEGLLLSEYENICHLFKRVEWGQVYQKTCRKALGEYAKTLRELNAHIKANLITDCFLAYEIVDIVSNLSFRLDRKTGELKISFSDALKSIRDTAKSSLEDLLDDTRRRVASLQFLPNDGSVLPLTIETMTRLQTLTAYQAPLSSIMTSLGDGNWSASTAPSTNSSSTSTGTKSFDVGADGRQLLAHYCTDTIEVLLSNLESKGKTMLKGKSLLGIFIANNAALIDRMVHSSDLITILSDNMNTIDSWRKKGKNLYLDAWKDPSTHLLDVQYTKGGGTRLSAGGTINSAEYIKGLGSKDKDAIKEKFRSFNASFDELIQRHKTFNLEPEVRQTIARDIQSMITPLYSRFWDRYHEIDKGKGKYVRYDKGSLSAMLNSLG